MENLLNTNVIKNSKISFIRFFKASNLQMKYLLVLLFVILSQIAFSQQVNFTNVFSPAESMVKAPEKPYREDVCLNGSWKFSPVNQAEKLKKEEILNPTIPTDIIWDTTPLKVPSPWNINSFAKGEGGDFITYPSYPKKWETTRAGWLMRKLPYSKEWKNKRLILHFDAINGYTQVFVNKQKVGENFDLFLPFEIDITDKVKEESDNELMIWVADAKLLDQPGKYGRRTYVGGSFWGDMITGIWQDVYLFVKPAIHIESTFVKPFLDRDELAVTVTIKNETSKKQELKIDGSIKPWINLAGKDVLDAPVPKWKLGDEVLSLVANKITIDPNSSKSINFSVKVDGKLEPWTSETPNLYGLVMKIDNKRQTIDQSYTRFGWRQVTLSKDKVYLNGKELHLKGDSWHFMGIPQLTRRYAWAWFTMLKQCNANAVRLHAQPYPSFYLDMADELGIFVLDETGIWASDGGPKCDSEDYWKSCEDHLKRLIDRDRNHPSVYGWSVCNENIPVVINVQHAPEYLVKRQLSEINKWVDMAQKLDPSRTWVSGDGETDQPTNLPTVIGHYGGESSYKNWSSQGKVWGVGECGMGYYGTPRQTAALNGNRSYESQQGRMEGIAMEASQLLNLQKKYGASYLSVFNIIWYGLKPLELGLADTTKAPKITDGIFFGPYREGQPGVQPERLGPYTSTLNPGYDPSLPLYRPWPLFDAVKNAFSETPSTISFEKSDKEVAQPFTPAKAVTCTLLLSADKDSLLYKALSDMGIDISAKMDKDKKANILLIIDGKQPKNDLQSISLEKLVLRQGGNVVIMGIKPESLSTINTFLPQPVKLTSRNAYSFVKVKPDPITGGLENSDFYFSEISRQPVMNYGIAGEFADNGKVLLKACNTDWKKWNYNGEYQKTAAVIRSERESKPEGNVMVAYPSENSNIYLISLEPDALNRVASPLIIRLFNNLGVTIKNINPKNMIAINLDGILERSLIAGAYKASGKTIAEMAQTNHLKDVKEDALYPGNIVKNRSLTIRRAVDGIFDFNSMNLQGPNENVVAYLSFWVYSPRSLANLLAEPNMPRLDMFIGADDGYQVYLNQKLLSESLEEGALEKRKHMISALPLEKGWNHFLIKSIQMGGDWQIAVEFESNNQEFMHQIKSQIAQ